MEISQQFDPNTRIQCVSGARGLHGQAVRKHVEKGVVIVTEHVPALLFVYLLINKNKMMFSFTELEFLHINVNNVVDFLILTQSLGYFPPNVDLKV